MKKVLSTMVAIGFLATLVVPGSAQAANKKHGGPGELLCFAPVLVLHPVGVAVAAGFVVGTVHHVFQQKCIVQVIVNRLTKHHKK
ncbi:MAG: hypothetical protein G01um101456_274 [Parcubacteria group bacterium Gr01-1014_56]|nr:MAG: hypothetical protein G01um101456_274 [Parcubacteria group bacterium Gr01-1014_56]